MIATINQKLGLKVREIRNNLNITQEELADLSNLHRTYIGQIERAEKNITLKNLEKVALALNTTPSKLLNFDNEGF